MDKEQFKAVKQRNWLFYFSIGLALVVIWKVLDNFGNITLWLNRLFSILMPFLVGILIAYILYLPCKKVEEAYKTTNKKNFFNKHARGLSILTTYILTAIILMIILNCIIPIILQSLGDLIYNIPNYYAQVTKKLSELPADNFLNNDSIKSAIAAAENIDLKQFVNPEKIFGYLRSMVSAINNIFNIFIAVVVSIYILAQRKGIVKFWGKFINSLIGEKKFKKVNKYFRNGNEIFFKFLTSQVIDALLVGIIVSAAMLLLKVKYAILLGFIIGLFNLIPFFGAIIAVIIAILVTALTGGIGKAILMAIVVIILQQIDANIINPKIVGSSLQISQLLVIFAVAIGGAYFGALGMFLAVPVATVIKMMMEDFIAEKQGKL